MSKHMPILVEYAKGQFINISEIKEIRTIYPVCPAAFLEKEQIDKKEFTLNESQIKRLKHDLLGERIDLIIITQKNRLIRHSYIERQETELSEFFSQLREHAIKAPENMNEYRTLSSSLKRKVFIVEEHIENGKRSRKLKYTELDINTDLGGTIKAVCKKLTIVSGLFSNIWEFITSWFS